MIKMYISLKVKYLLLLSDFNETLIFSPEFSKNTQILNITTIGPEGADLFHVDRETDGRA